MVMRGGEDIERLDEDLHDRRKRGFKLAGAGILIAVVLALGLANFDDVKVDFLVQDVTLPLVFIILGSAIVGALAATFFHWFRGRRHD